MVEHTEWILIKYMYTYKKNMAICGTVNNVNKFNIIKIKLIFREYRVVAQNAQFHFSFQQKSLVSLSVFDENV
jgi:hypothetical protein